jgi:hypothetical protein
MTRRRWLWLVGLIVVGALLGAVAAGIARQGRESATASATPASVVAGSTSGARPTTTAASSASPSAEVPAPTAEPAQPTTAPASGRTSFAAFGRHVERAGERGTALLGELRVAAEALDVPAVGTASAKLGDWAATESAWLDDHPPRRCYADVHAGYGDALAEFGQAAGIMERFAADFPFADYDSIQEALDLAESGSTKLQAAGQLVPGVRCSA